MQLFCRLMLLLFVRWIILLDICDSALNKLFEKLTLYSFLRADFERARDRLRCFLITLALKLSTGPTNCFKSD